MMMMMMMNGHFFVRTCYCLDIHFVKRDNRKKLAADQSYNNCSTMSHKNIDDKLRTIYNC